jgi:hypothetical protein
VSIQANQEPMKRLAPGVYDDEQGGLHLDIAEFLDANGYADTPENRDTLINAAREAYGNITVTAAPLAVFTERPSYKCPACGRVSYHPKDIQERYCGACHCFEDP